MTSPRRAAPRRRVLQVVKTGKYPNVQWLHRLDCSHTESRKRKAPTEEIGCTTCLATSRLKGTESDPIVFDESLYAGTRAELSAALGCDQSAIRIEVDSTGRVLGAAVFLTLQEITKLKESS